MINAVSIISEQVESKEPEVGKFLTHIDSHFSNKTDRFHNLPKCEAILSFAIMGIHSKTTLS